MKTNNYISIILLSFLGVILFIFCFNFQESLNYENCSKCDGNQYLNMYNYFNNNTTDYNILFPFNTRIFVPFLSSLLPFSSTILNFHFTNIIFIIISLIAIYMFWLELKINTSLKIIGFCWLMFHWVGIVRHKLFDVINVDTPLYFFHSILMLVIYKRKLWFLPILSVIATSQKESISAYLIILLIYAIAHNKFYEKYFNITPILVSVILSFITKYSINYFFPPLIENTNSFMVVLFHIKQIFINPESIVIWIIAVFTVYGSFLLLTSITKSKTEYTPENNILFVFMLLSLALSIVAGGDFTRISFLGFPFIMSWILLKLNNSSVLEIGAAIILSIPLLRIFSTIPQPNYDALSHPWFIEIASIENIAVWGIYMIACYLVLIRVSKSVN